MWMIQTIFSKLFSILFPPSCIKCHKEGDSFCTECLSFCKKSIDGPNAYFISIYSFKDPFIKKAIHSIKYFHKKDLVRSLSKELAVEIQKEILLGEKNTTWLLVPIPMPKFRKYVRGYNQAEILADEINKQTQQTSILHALTRNRSPKRQVTTKTRSERLLNQQGSFKTIEDVKGAHIILIDDVITTGATLEAARKTLLLSGAHTVRAATIAH